MSDNFSSELIHLWRPPTAERPALATELFDVVYKGNQDAVAEMAAADNGFDFDPELLLADRIEPFEDQLKHLYSSPCTALSTGIQVAKDDEWKPVNAFDGRILGVRGWLGIITTLQYEDDVNPDYGLEIWDARVSYDIRGGNRADFRTEVAFVPIIPTRLLKYVETVDFEIDPTEVIT